MNIPGIARLPPDIAPPQGRSKQHLPREHPLRERPLEWQDDLANFLALAGRALFSSIFLLSGINHFRKQTIDYAARQGVPLARLLVPLSGAMAIAGGLSVLLGFRPKIGAALLVGFLVPVSVKMHRFWGVKDPQVAQDQQIHFMKNLSMLGGALLISRVGTGPFSLDNQRRIRLINARRLGLA